MLFLWNWKDYLAPEKKRYAVLRQNQSGRSITQ
jgi:hypothetical protein